MAFRHGVRRLESLLAGGLLVAGAACGRPPSPAPDAGDPRLLAVVAAGRPGGARLVGAPWSAPRDLAALRVAPVELRRAAARTRQDLQRVRSPENLRRDALWALSAAQPDLAVAELVEAEQAAPADAGLSSDLAAALLSQAAVRQDPAILVTALAATDRAVVHGPALAPARFNRALVLERLSLREQAGAEWRECQRADRDAAWRHEEIVHADALREPASAATSWLVDRAALTAAAGRHDIAEVGALVGRHRQRSREHFIEELLVSWAAAAVDRRGAAAQQRLAVARAIGDALAAATGDDLAAATIAQIDRLGLAPAQTASRRALAGALAAYGRGLELARRGRFSAALSPLTEAHRVLVGLQSPFAGWVRFQLSLCRYERFEYDAAMRLLQPLVAGNTLHRPSALRGRSLVLTGLIETIRGEPDAAFTAYTRALAEFQRLGEESNAAKVGSQAALTLDLLGRPAEAWRWLYPALLEPATLATPLVRFGNCEIAGRLAEEQGDLEVALQFQDEVVRSSQDSGSAAAEVSAHLRRAAMRASLGRLPAATADLQRAGGLLVKLPEARTRNILAGDLLLVRGGILLQQSPRAAIDFLDGAVATFRRSQYRYRLRQALVLRAQAEERLQLVPAVRHDLLDALRESERLRASIVPIEERISYFDSLRAMFDALVAFEVSQGDGVAALSYAERARARALLDWLRAAAPPPSAARRPPAVATPLAGADLCRQLPPDTVLLEYWSLPDRLLLWRVHSSGVSLRTVSVSAAELQLLVERLSQAARAGDRSRLQQESSTLYRLLVQPVAERLPPGCRVAFVPDGPLHALPFALLRDPRSGRLLIQDHGVAVAPSATLFAVSRSRVRERPASGPRMLYFEDPAFDGAAHPDLARLPAAPGRKVAALFPGSRVRAGRDATRSSFLAEAGNYDIVHFGGHALVSSSSPLLSRLVFAGEPGEPHDGIVYARDLLGLRLSRTRLAVLASCSTAAGPVSGTEGVVSLARPLLAAGVPGVVASLWRIDDAEAARFFDRFYTHLAQGESAIDALQAADVESLDQEGSQSFTWAAFELIGAG